MKHWRLIAAAILIAGFPAWFVFWIKTPNVLIFLYAVMGYAVLTAYLGATGAVRKFRL